MARRRFSNVYHFQIVGVHLIGWRFGLRFQYRLRRLGRQELLLWRQLHVRIVRLRRRDVQL